MDEDNSWVGGRPLPSSCFHEMEGRSLGTDRPMVPYRAPEALRGELDPLVLHEIVALRKSGRKLSVFEADRLRRLEDEALLDGFKRCIIAGHLVECIYDDCDPERIAITSMADIPVLTPPAGWTCPREIKVPKDILVTFGGPRWTLPSSPYQYAWRQPHQWCNRLHALGFRGIADGTGRWQRGNEVFTLTTIPDCAKTVLLLTRV